MSQEDDEALLAMAASRMSTAGIAQTMGWPWTEPKVYNRLAQLRSWTANPPLIVTAVPDGAETLDLRPGVMIRAPITPPPTITPAPWVRYARWFLAAGWPAHQVAHLFNVETCDVQAIA